MTEAIEEAADPINWFIAQKFAEDRKLRFNSDRKRKMKEVFEVFSRKVEEETTGDPSTDDFHSKFLKMTAIKRAAVLSNTVDEVIAMPPEQTPKKTDIVLLAGDTGSGMSTTSLWAMGPVPSKMNDHYHAPISPSVSLSLG